MSNLHSVPLLVTGAAGFIGSAFVASCNQRGLPVLSVDRAKHFADRSEHHGIGFGTLIDREELPQWLEHNSPPRAIVHLGACANTMETDVSFLNRWNVEYSKLLWEFATRHQIPLIYASSAATYGDGAQGYDDNEALAPSLKPLNPYGQSKLDFDLWALKQEQQGHHPAHWAGFKFFNVYGFGERHKGPMASVVLHAFDQIRKTGQLRLFKSHRAGIADGHQKRDFVHIDDVIQVLHFALERPIERGILNLGTGQARTFLDLALAVFHSLGQPERIEFIATPEAIRDRYQYFTQARMERLRALGYSREFLSLEEGVKRYVGRLMSAAR